MRFMKKVRWGVLGVARIAVNRVIPAMQAGEWSEITAIASRDRGRAESAASDLKHSQGVRLLRGADRRSRDRRNLQSAAESPARAVVDARSGGRETRAVREADRSERGGGAAPGGGPRPHGREHGRSIHGADRIRSGCGSWNWCAAGGSGSCGQRSGTFSYFKLEAENIRNIREYGGGGLMDIGCYPIKTSRMVFGEEPVRVSAAIARDPRFGNIDMLTSAILEFPSGHCVFTCSTQIMQQQSMCFLRDHGEDRAGDSV